MVIVLMNGTCQVDVTYNESGKNEYHKVIANLRINKSVHSFISLVIVIFILIVLGQQAKVSFVKKVKLKF